MSVLGWTDTFDPNVSTNSVVAVVQVHLLTGSSGCWVDQTQTFAV